MLSARAAISDGDAAGTPVFGCIAHPVVSMKTAKMQRVTNFIWGCTIWRTMIWFCVACLFYLRLSIIIKLLFQCPTQRAVMRAHDTSGITSLS